MEIKVNQEQNRQRGFTLIELLVTLVIMGILILFVMDLFERTTRVSGTQAGLADLQQNQRVVQRELTKMIRTAGRGGLPHSQATHRLPTGPAVSLRSNVAEDERLVPANSDTPLLVAGTDVLTIRGVQGHLLHLEGSDPTRYSLPEAADPLNTPGFVIVRRALPLTPRGFSAADLDEEACQANIFCQPIEILADLVDDGPVGEAILLADSRDSSLVAVVNFTGGVVTEVDDIPTEVRINFDRTQVAYQALAPLTNIATVGLVGILEEWRYFVKKRVSPAPENTTVAWKPVFTKARFLPNSNTEWNADDANFNIEIAENVENFQVALGIDKNANFLIDENANAASDSDEWLYDHPSDNTAVAQWNSLNPAVDPLGRLFKLRAVRVTTLSLSDYAEPFYADPVSPAIEDRLEMVPGQNADFEVVNRRVRRRQLQTIIKIRNL